MFKKYHTRQIIDISLRSENSHKSVKYCLCCLFHGVVVVYARAWLRILPRLKPRSWSFSAESCVSCRARWKVSYSILHTHTHRVYMNECVFHVCLRVFVCVRARAPVAHLDEIDSSSYDVFTCRRSTGKIHPVALKDKCYCVITILTRWIR